MQLNELVAVLEHIDTSIHDTDLLIAQKALATALAALADGDRSSLPTVQTQRARLAAILQRCEPSGWTRSQLAIFDSYGGRAVLGDPVAEQLDAAFVEHFMDPVALHAFVADLRARTLQLAETVAELLGGLAPVLGDVVNDAATLTGELVDSHDARALQPMQRAGGDRGLWRNVRSRLNLPATRREPADAATLATRVVAAAPLILAAAAKALELYRDYSERQAPAVAHRPSVAPKPVVQPPVAPVVPPAQPLPGASYVRYTYRQSVYIISNDD